jgi:hypothetical protein
MATSFPIGVPPAMAVAHLLVVSSTTDMGAYMIRTYIYYYTLPVLSNQGGSGLRHVIDNAIIRETG